MIHFPFSIPGTFPPQPYELKPLFYSFQSIRHDDTYPISLSRSLSRSLSHSLSLSLSHSVSLFHFLQAPPLAEAFWIFLSPSLSLIPAFLFHPRRNKSLSLCSLKKYFSCSLRIKLVKQVFTSLILIEATTKVWFIARVLLHWAQIIFWWCFHQTTDEVHYLPIILVIGIENRKPDILF